jgi:hypothetical protein
VNFVVSNIEGGDRAQMRKLGEELRSVEGRVFGSWRVEIVTSCSVRGDPPYQLLPALAHAPARTREPGEDQPPTTGAARAGAHARAGRRREPPSPAAAWKRQHEPPPF